MKNSNNKRNQIVTRSTVKQMISGARLANAELKSFNIAQTGIAPALAGTIYNVTRAIVLGDGASQRDGSQINVKSLQIRANTRSASTSTVRWILFSDTQNNGTDPAVVDVLASATFISQYNNVLLNEQRRFKIIMDQLVDLSTNGVMNHTFTKKLTNFPKKITYLGSTDISGASGRNAIFLLVIGSSTVPFFDYDINVRYLDQ